jgi:hypothetical protein
VEDPVRFDVWALVVPSRREEAVDILRAASPNESELAVRLLVNGAVRRSERVLVARGLGYAAAREVVDSPGAAFHGARLVQAHDTYRDDMAFCLRHGLSHRQGARCNVCWDFFVP